MRRYPILVIAAVLSISPTLRAQGPATGEQRAQAAEVRRLRMARDAVRELMRGEISLPEALRRAGGKLDLSAAPNPDAFTAINLDALTKASRLVIVGRPVQAPLAQAYDNGDPGSLMIVSRYQIREHLARCARLTARAERRLAASIGSAGIVAKAGSSRCVTPGCVR